MVPVIVRTGTRIYTFRHTQLVETRSEESILACCHYTMPGTCPDSGIRTHNTSLSAM